MFVLIIRWPPIRDHVPYKNTFMWHHALFVLAASHIFTPYLPECTGQKLVHRFESDQQYSNLFGLQCRMTPHAIPSNSKSTCIGGHSHVRAGRRVLVSSMAVTRRRPTRGRAWCGYTGSRLQSTDGRGPQQATELLNTISTWCNTHTQVTSSGTYRKPPQAQRPFPSQCTRIKYLIILSFQNKPKLFNFPKNFTYLKNVCKLFKIFTIFNQIFPKIYLFNMNYF